MTIWPLQKTARGWRLPIEQREVSRCIVDHAFTLEFHEKGKRLVDVRIEGAFSILDRRCVHQLSPEAPLGLGPAIALFGQVVRSATISAQGKLEIAFEDDRTLSVEPDEHNEAWVLSGPGGMLAVCMPGGDVAIWQPKDEPTPHSS